MQHRAINIGELPHNKSFKADAFGAALTPALDAPCGGQKKKDLSIKILIRA